MAPPPGMMSVIAPPGMAPGHGHSHGHGALPPMRNDGSETASLHVAGWAVGDPAITRDSLLRRFRPFGEVRSVAVKRDYAFVNFAAAADAFVARQRLQGAPCLGGIGVPGSPPLSIKYAKEFGSPPGGGGPPSSHQQEASMSSSSSSLSPRGGGESRPTASLHVSGFGPRATRESLAAALGGAIIAGGSAGGSAGGCAGGFAGSSAGGPVGGSESGSEAALDASVGAARGEDTAEATTTTTSGGGGGDDSDGGDIGGGGGGGGGGGEEAAAAAAASVGGGGGSPALWPIVRVALKRDYAFVNFRNAEDAGACRAAALASGAACDGGLLRIGFARELTPSGQALGQHPPVASVGGGARGAEGARAGSRERDAPGGEDSAGGCGSESPPYVPSRRSDDGEGGDNDRHRGDDRGTDDRDDDRGSFGDGGDSPPYIPASARDRGED